MDWDRIEGNWKQFKGMAKQKWSRPGNGGADGFADPLNITGGRAQTPFKTAGEDLSTIVVRESKSLL